MSARFKFSSVLVVGLLLGCDLRKTPEEIKADLPRKCKIVLTYDERRFGSADGTTVVEDESGARAILVTKMGNPGDTVIIDGRRFESNKLASESF